jgi:hypothetical protein
LASNPYVSLSGYQSYNYPSLSYSPYSYPSLIGLNAYPNTLSTILPQQTDLSHLTVDISTLPIVPDDLTEGPKQPDNRLHDLNPYNSFSYHAPDSKSKLYPEREPIEPAPNMLRHLFSPLFTSPSNFQYILPNGRIGELNYYVPPFETKQYTTAEVNKQIYDAKKAKGEEVVYDIIGRPYDPNKKYDLNDSQDFVDENLAGQILDYYQYNTLDPTINTPQNQVFINNLTQVALKDTYATPLGDLFISDVLGSDTALASPLKKASGDYTYPNYNAYYNSTPNYNPYYSTPNYNAYYNSTPNYNVYASNPYSTYSYPANLF